MKKHAVLLVLAGLEAVAVAVGAFFWLRMRPELMAAYGGAGAVAEELPWATYVALTSWFAPAIGGIGSACVLAGVLLRARMRARVALAASGLVVTAFGLAFAVIAAHAPAFAGLARG